MKNKTKFIYSIYAQPSLAESNDFLFHLIGNARKIGTNSIKHRMCALD